MNIAIWLANLSELHTISVQQGKHKTSQLSIWQLTGQLLLAPNLIAHDQSCLFL